MRLKGYAAVLFICVTVSTSPATPSDTTHDGIWEGVMICGDPGAEIAFTAARRALVKQGRITLRRGIPNRDRFEAWEGIIHDSGSVMIFGRYHWEVEKPLWFKGQIEGRNLTAIGQRGPKICELTLTRIGAAPSPSPHPPNGNEP